jgi:hypothetical protein
MAPAGWSTGLSDRSPSDCSTAKFSIVKRLDAELGSILIRWLWLGCRDRNQKARCPVSMLDLVAEREVAASVNRPNQPERPAEQWMRRITHSHFDDG